MLGKEEILLGIYVGIRTSLAVEVSEVENVGGTALGRAASADGDLAVDKSRGSGGGDSESDDGEELHLDDCWGGFWWWEELIGWKDGW